jgi:hypothetical protein
MRGWSFLFLMVLAISAWVIAVIFGPTVVKQEAVFWDIGWIMMSFAFGVWVSIMYAYKYSYHIDWPNYNSTLHQLQPIDKVTLHEVPIPDQSGQKHGKERELPFVVYSTGGAKSIPLVGGGKKAIVFAYAPLVKMDEGDVCNVHIRSNPDVFVKNPDRELYERTWDQLPIEFKDVLSRWRIGEGTPVYLAMEPLAQVELDKFEAERLKYKDLWFQANEKGAKLESMLDSYGSGATNIAKTFELQTKVFRKDAQPKKKGIFEREDGENRGDDN